MSKPCRPARRRLADPRGAILIICLMLMLVAAALAGIIMILARSEASMSATARGNVQAANAAEYGIEFAISNLNPTQPAAFAPQTIAPHVQVVSGLRNGSNGAPQNQGPAICPPGQSLNMGCNAFQFSATGQARGWLAVTASTQIQTVEILGMGCRGTEFNLC